MRRVENHKTFSRMCPLKKESKPGMCLICEHDKTIELPFRRIDNGKMSRGHAKARICKLRGF